MMFTVEEINLIHSVDHTTRRMAVFELGLPAPDSELKEICEKTLRKVSAMTDEEFAASDFTVYEEDEKNG